MPHQLAFMSRRWAPLLAALLFAAGAMPLAASAAETPTHTRTGQHAKKSHVKKVNHTKPTHVAATKHAKHTKKAGKASDKAAEKGAKKQARAPRAPA